MDNYNGWQVMTRYFHQPLYISQVTLYCKKELSCLPHSLFIYLSIIHLLFIIYLLIYLQQYELTESYLIQ